MNWTHLYGQRRSLCNMQPNTAEAKLTQTVWYRIDSPTLSHRIFCVCSSWMVWDGTQKPGERKPSKREINLLHQQWSALIPSLRPTRRQSRSTGDFLKEQTKKKRMQLFHSDVQLFPCWYMVIRHTGIVSYFSHLRLTYQSPGKKVFLHRSNYLPEPFQTTHQIKLYTLAERYNYYTLH